MSDFSDHQKLVDDYLKNMTTKFTMPNLCLPSICVVMPNTSKSTTYPHRISPQRL